jgi:hypothetical protein
VSSVSAKETVPNDSTETVSSPDQERTLDDPLHLLTAKFSSPSSKQPGFSSASREASAEQLPNPSPLFADALSDQHQSDLHSSTTGEPKVSPVSSLISSRSSKPSKQGSSRWFALCIALGFNEVEITVVCDGKLHYSDKLLAISSRTCMVEG